MAMNLRLVHQAVALARHRNFARAAKALHVTQPTLSRGIAALEEQLGVRLFDRDPKGVRPTTFGEVLLQRGAALLDRADDLSREIQLLAGLEAGTLVIGAGPYAAELSVGPAMGRLLRQHPRLKMRVVAASPEEVVAKVLDGEFDVGVADCKLPAKDESLTVEPLPSHKVLLSCRVGHPLAGKRGLRLNQVLEYPLVSTVLIGDAAGNASLDTRAGTFDPIHRTFASAIQVNSLSVAREIARSSDALFPGTASMFAADIALGRLEVLDFFIPAMRTTYSLLYPRGRSLSPAAQAFISALRDAEADLAAANDTNQPATVRRRASSRKGIVRD